MRCISEMKNEKQRRYGHRSEHLETESLLVPLGQSTYDRSAACESFTLKMQWH